MIDRVDEYYNVNYFTRSAIPECAATPSTAHAPRLDIMAKQSLSCGDWAFVTSFVAFAITSFCFEPFVMWGCGGDGGLAVCAEKFEAGTWWMLPGAVFHWYAKSFDPVFLHTPSWLALMCGLDMCLFGPCYLAMLTGFLWRPRAEWLRWLGLAYSAAITYSYVA